MKSVWKFPLEITDLQPLVIPKDVHLLSVQMQHGVLCLWALVDADAPKETRLIEILGTGNSAPEAVRAFIATAQMAGGSLVWHVFERTAARRPVLEAEEVASTPPRLPDARKHRD